MIPPMQLALEVAQLLKDGIGLTEAPAEKQSTGDMHWKFFAKVITSKLRSSTATANSGCSTASLGYAVSEVIGAVFTEAETRRLTTDILDARVELHGSTDASWKGTTARGSGIAMNAAGRELVTAAASHVAEGGVAENDVGRD